MIGNKTISDREGDGVVDLDTEVKVWRRLLKAMENHTDQDVKGFWVAPRPQMELEPMTLQGHPSLLLWDFLQPCCMVGIYQQNTQGTGSIQA